MRKVIIVLCLMFVASVSWGFEVGDIVQESGRGKYKIDRITLCEPYSASLIYLTDLKTYKYVSNSFSPNCLSYHPDMIGILSKRVKELENEVVWLKNCYENYKLQLEYLQKQYDELFDDYKKELDKNMKLKEQLDKL